MGAYSVNNALAIFTCLNVWENKFSYFPNNIVNISNKEMFDSLWLAKQVIAKCQFYKAPREGWFVSTKEEVGKGGGFLFE